MQIKELIQHLTQAEGIDPNKMRMLHESNSVNPFAPIKRLNDYNVYVCNEDVGNILQKLYTLNFRQTPVTCPITFEKLRDVYYNYGFNPYESNACFDNCTGKWYLFTILDLKSFDEQNTTEVSILNHDLFGISDLFKDDGDNAKGIHEIALNNILDDYKHLNINVEPQTAKTLFKANDAKKLATWLLENNLKVLDKLM